MHDRQQLSISSFPDEMSFDVLRVPRGSPIRKPSDLFRGTAGESRAINKTPISESARHVGTAVPVLVSLCTVVRD